MSFADDLQERLHAYAMGCVQFVRTLPCTDEARDWGGQLRRASTGASAIYRVSRRGKSKPDWLDKIADTVEELDECEPSLATGRANQRRRKEQSRRRRPRSEEP